MTDLDALVATVAAAVHAARFPPGREPTPFEEEDARGQEYCRRIARAAIEASAIERLKQALEPFSAAADFKESGYTFDVPDTVYCDVTLGDCRKARAALSSEKAGSQ